MKSPAFPVFAAFACVLLIGTAGDAQQPARVAGRIDSARRMVLAGRVHRKAIPQNDLGAVDPAFEMPGVTLVLKPSAEGQTALTQFLQEQQDPGSPSYH